MQDTPQIWLENLTIRTDSKMNQAHVTHQKFNKMTKYFHAFNN